MKTFIIYLSRLLWVLVAMWVFLQLWQAGATLQLQSAGFSLQEPGLLQSRAPGHVCLSPYSAWA